MSVKEQIREWLNGTDAGQSSKSLAYEAADLPGDRSNYPHDPSDLGRCLRLIARVPEVRSAVDALADKSPYWKALAPEWDRLKALYISEMNDPKGGRKTYDAMRALLEPVEKADKRLFQIGKGISIRISQ